MDLDNIKSFSMNYYDIQHNDKKMLSNHPSQSSGTFNKLCYYSEKHPKVTLDSVNLLRKHGEFCDVALIVGGKKILAHRIVLSACSPYFKAMFTGELAESQQTEITLKDIDENAVDAAIEFCYTSQIVIEEWNVQCLLPAACLLQLSGNFITIWESL